MRTTLTPFVIGMFVATFASPAVAVPDKCQKALSKEILKLESKILKSIVKGADTYQKAEVKGTAIASITGKVNDTLAKAIDVSNPKSAVAKTLDKLASIGPSDKATCTDVDLFSLGFLPEALAGDRWRRLAAVAALHTAYENASLGNGTLSNDYQAMVEAGGCSLCSMLAKPPCASSICSLDAGSGGETKSATGTIAITTSGAAVTGACNVPSLMPAGEFATVTGPQRGIHPVVISATPGNQVVACVTAQRAMGVLNCSGTMPTVDSDVCVDHIVQDIGGILVDECETGGGSVQLAQPDVDDAVHAGVLNGGPVMTYTTGPPAPGESFLLTTNQIQVLLEAAGDFGTDGVPCTPDDSPATVTPPAVQAQTTGTATTQVFDSNNTEGNGLTTTGSVSGSPFDCAVSPSGILSGGVTVSAFSALHAIFNFDQAVNNSLICQ